MMLEEYDSKVLSLPRSRRWRKRTWAIGEEGQGGSCVFRRGAYSQANSSYIRARLSLTLCGGGVVRQSAPGETSLLPQCQCARGSRGSGMSVVLSVQNSNI